MTQPEQLLTELDRLTRIESAARAMFASEDGVCVECGWVGDHESLDMDAEARRCLTLPLRRALYVEAALPATCSNCGAAAHPETPHYFDKPVAALPVPALDAPKQCADCDHERARHDDTDECCVFGCYCRRYLPALPVPALDAERLGFADLLAVGQALLEHYPPNTIVCSHSPEADIGARTVAAISDLIDSCGAALRGEADRG